MSVVSAMPSGLGLWGAVLAASNYVALARPSSLTSFFLRILRSRGSYSWIWVKKVPTKHMYVYMCVYIYIGRIQVCSIKNRKEI